MHNIDEKNELFCEYRHKNQQTIETKEAHSQEIPTHLQIKYFASDLFILKIFAQNIVKQK